MKFKDTDHLHASSRVRMIEQKLLGAEALRKMVEARGLDEAWKIAGDAGIGVGMQPEDYERALAASLAQAYETAGELLPGRDGVLALFRLRYDAHNLKTLVKSLRAGARDELLSPLGNVPPDKLKEQFEAREFGGELDAELAAAAVSAAEGLLKNGDPQAVDLAIDKAWLTSLGERAAEYDNAFIRDWAAATIDIANIRALFRVKRMRRDGALLSEALAPGGTFDPEELAAVLPKDWDEVFALVARSPSAPDIAPAFDEVKSGGTLSRFERLCDDAVIARVCAARGVPFGIEPVLAWVLAKEYEAQGARIVFACKRANIPPADIMERLRDSYAQ